ncbi:ribonuclease H-like domain-containing protein [Tanacetum coccineum]|uniref:Ribonuclease H-like domain-containing protein n=1 Tax=Tanacetum coccineum TaxID=301880 RepID=A0ABQ4Y9W2_9ASTR
MSETEPIPPTSSVTALRIPMIKKGEYDLWSMKMRQYIAITDHILWDIITNGDQATTDPASSSAPKTSLAANARRNNEKALNILLSAIPDRHLLSFHVCLNAKTLWTAIKARFGGNDASKKMQKNLLKQQFETFTIGSREELDSAYERFQNILSMLELYDAKVSLEDANLKFLRSLPSVWHVVATMIRGQPGLDELEFDDLYNNLKVTLITKVVEPAFPKRICQAASSTVQTVLACASHSEKSIIIGRQEKRIVAIEDSNSKALVATDNNEDIDWTKEFDAEPVTYAMMALTEVEQDDWSMEFDAEHMHFGQDGLELPLTVPYCSKSYKKLLESYQTERDNFQKARTEILGYQMSLESLEVILKTHEKNEYAWGDKYEQMEYDLKMRDLKLEEKQKELDQALRERDDFKDNGSYTSSNLRPIRRRSHKTMLFMTVDAWSRTGARGNKLSDFKDSKGGLWLLEMTLRGRISGKEPFKTNWHRLWKVSYVEELSSISSLSWGSQRSITLTKVGYKAILVRGLPSEHSSLITHVWLVERGNSNRASCKKIEVKKLVRELLNCSIWIVWTCFSRGAVNRKKYCLVVTDDCSKFSWVFFLAYKDETYDMLHDLIVGLENKLRHKVKTIRTPQQNGVAERKNRTLIEAARTMLADSLLPIQFWAEAVNTACYVLNRVLVTKPQMKTPYEILMGRSNISLSDEGYLLGYSYNSKRENQKGKGPDWMFDLELLTPSMNYIPVRKENYAASGGNVSTLNDVEDLDDQQFIVHTAQTMHSEEHTADK